MLPEQGFRGFFRIDGKNVLVFDELEPPTNDKGYLPGLFTDLCKRYEDRDYFTVYLVDDVGKMKDSMGSMAGYGSPEKAARAAVRDYWTSQI